MNNLTNEQIAKVFATYQFTQADGYHYDTQMGIQAWSISDILSTKDEVHEVFRGSKERAITFSKLLLTPLSAITDEDAIEVARICTGLKDGWQIGKAKGNYWRYVERKDGGTLEVRIFFKQLHICVCNVYSNSVALSDNPVANLAIQYLIQQGYAVPLFIAPGHPDNGKTAIELGLAIDKQTHPE